MTEDLAISPSLAGSRDGMAILADIVLPGTNRLPSGRSVGVHADLLDRVVQADPGLTPAIIAAAKRVMDTGATSIDDLEAWEPETREPVIFALNAGYYMSRAVHRALNYPGLTPHSISNVRPDESCSDELLAPVLERGAVYVKVDD